MSVRDDLHALLDRLPEDILPAVARYLAAVGAGLPADLLPEDEELSPEEAAMWTESKAALARGDVVTHEEVLARRAARRGQL